jgi:hypothetical protein
VKFGEGFIGISGQIIGESSEPYDAPETAGINESGDLTGQRAGAVRFFKNPVYEGNSKIVTISPEETGTLTALPPGDIVIPLTVGTNLKSPNGNGMADPVSFYYRTNTLEVKNAYTAKNIWTIHP